MENRLRQVRIEIGMSVSELARRAGTTRQTIHAIEAKKRKRIDGNLMFRIADALKREEREIFFAKSVIHGEHSKASSA